MIVSLLTPAVNWPGVLLFALSFDFANEEFPFWIHDVPIFVDILNGSHILNLPISVFIAVPCVVVVLPIYCEVEQPRPSTNDVLNPT
jgi:membrane-associated phospholipid phosphatase